MCGAAGAEDTARGQLEEEEDVQTPQQHGVDGEEVAGQRGSGVGTQEGAPGGPTPSWSWLNAMSAEDAADGGHRDRMSELAQLALDAEIAPRWVLRSQAQDKLVDLPPTPGGRLPRVRAAGPLTVAVNTREKYGWKFAGRPVTLERHAISSGDYAAVIDGTVAGAVERKTLENLATSLSDCSLAFQMQRLAEAGRVAIVVEGDYPDLFRTQPGRGSWLADMLGRMAVRYSEVRSCSLDRDVCGGVGLPLPRCRGRRRSVPGRGHTEQRTALADSHTDDASFETRQAREPVDVSALPPSNAFMERWFGSLRRECLDRLLIVGRRHVERALQMCVDHYNRHRPHRSLD
jgi:Integrase core domain